MNWIRKKVLFICLLIPCCILPLFIFGCSSSDSDSPGGHNDETAPVITLNGEAVLFVILDGIFSDPGATALDNVDGDLTSRIVVNGNIDTSVVSEQTITYNVSDAAGNAAEQVVRIVHVVDNPPASPSGLSADTSYLQINLTWIDNADNEEGFTIERALDAEFTAVTTIPVTANTTSYSDTDLNAATQYFYRVIAYNIIGDSDYSNITDATTEQQSLQGGVEYGFAADYPNDQSIENHPSVIFASGFEDSNWPDDFNYTRTIPTGYTQITNPTEAYTGNGYFEIQQTEGTHQPYEFHPAMPDNDIVYVRWYRKYEEGYDWIQHKMSGVYAKRPGLPGGGAGIPPDGTDKYSCKLYVSWDGEPKFYTYHPEQAGPYGDGLPQNIGTPIKLETERWYCFEMMIKSNTPGVKIGDNQYTEGAHDGELKMWIDGVLKGHYTGMRFRDSNELFINEFTHSAYVGGNWVSERDQKLWEDNYVVATEYIGPIPDNNSRLAQQAGRHL